MSIRKNEDGSTTITMPLEGTNFDGSPRVMVVELPPGQELDSLTADQIVEAAMRAVRRRGSA